MWCELGKSTINNWELKEEHQNDERNQVKEKLNWKVERAGKHVQRAVEDWRTTKQVALWTCSSYRKVQKEYWWTGENLSEESKTTSSTRENGEQFRERVSTIGGGSRREDLWNWAKIWQ